MTTVWMLTHFSSSGHEKIIGIYASEDDVKAARERTAKLPGFRLEPDRFDVLPMTVGEDAFPEGFEELEDAVELH